MATTTFSTISSKLGVHVKTTSHNTQAAAELSAHRAIRCGAADSAAVWTAGNAISYFGAGR